VRLKGLWSMANEAMKRDPGKMECREVFFQENNSKHIVSITMQRTYLIAFLLVGILSKVLRQERS
jgi:hypothetical protein